MHACITDAERVCTGGDCAWALSAEHAPLANMRCAARKALFDSKDVPRKEEFRTCRATRGCLSSMVRNCFMMVVRLWMFGCSPHANSVTQIGLLYV